VLRLRRKDAQQPADAGNREPRCLSQSYSSSAKARSFYRDCGSATIKESMPFVGAYPERHPWVCLRAGKSESARVGMTVRWTWLDMRQ
jgi:hypothetical protein